MIEATQLGKRGVNVDKSPLEMDDNELRQAQNVTSDTVGSGVGFVNRPGLLNLNSSAEASGVKGGTHLPIGDVALTGSPANAPRIYVGPYTTGQWQYSADQWATAVNAGVGTPGPCLDVGNKLPAGMTTNLSGGGCKGPRLGVFVNGNCYYSYNTYTQGTDPAPIHKFNGIDDSEFSKVFSCKAIMCMATVAGRVFLGTWDTGTTDADFSGRVFEMDLDTGGLTQIGTALTVGHLPFSLEYHNSNLYVGTMRVTNTNRAFIYRINPRTETTWTADLDGSGGSGLGEYIYTGLKSYKGLLYATTAADGNNGTRKSRIIQRSTAGVWTTVDSDTAVSASCRYGQPIIFKNILLVGRSATTGIRYSTDGSTWASASTSDGRFLYTNGVRAFSVGENFTFSSSAGSSGWAGTVATPSPAAHCVAVIPQRTL